MERCRVEIGGAVQGVGFRPFVYRIARDQRLTGWVENNACGVTLEVEGERSDLDEFLLRLESERPAPALVTNLQVARVEAVGSKEFLIRESESGGPRRALVLPDLALCTECAREIRDPANRRYRYPFTNCTHCGPRFSIISALPYDRPNTTMAGFQMCRECRSEYDDPGDRRFHAQPNACPACGPSLALLNARGALIAQDAGALAAAARALGEGQILAVKGVGGFHLMADARSESVVGELRARKRREEKPFAVMLPGAEAVARCAFCSPEELALLESPEAPIVLLRKRELASVAPGVAPGNPRLGVMLPNTPLQHLLALETDFPLIATSGNLSDEPICIDNDEALSRLHGIADLFLVHDRPILRPVDDSVARVELGRTMLLRRARGYAPLPLRVGDPSVGKAVLAVGAHLKSAIALATGQDVFVSQHIGDLETNEAYRSFERIARDLPRFYDAAPALVVADLHPGYRSTRFAESLGIPVVPLQHHRAHVLACMAENQLDGSVLGVAWDGTGAGEDGTIWGGECFRSRGNGPLERVAHLRPFALPGGETAVREPRRSAIGLLREEFGPDWLEMEGLASIAAFTPSERQVLERAMARGINAPRTSSIGRLFDGVAALLGARQVHRYEGQAAMELEALSEGFEASGSYPMPLVERPDGPAWLDWGPMMRAILGDLEANAPAGVIGARFHGALIDGIVATAHWAGVEPVALAGGCFLNGVLLRGAVAELRAAGFTPYWHSQVPPGDGSICLGQAVYGQAILAAGEARLSDRQE